MATTDTENQKSLININNTSYNIQNDWFEIIKKYFDVTDDDEEAIHFLKAGLFGYNNEIISNEIKNNVYHRNIIYDEHFLNSASFPESIFNFAKTYNYEVDMARPSQCRINFCIKKSDLVNNKFATEVTTELGDIASANKTYELILNNDFTFMMDNIQFKLPYPIKITFRETADKTDFSLVATYDNTYEFPYFKLTNTYVKLWQEYIDGEKMVFMGLDLFQIEKETKEFDIVSEDITDNLFYNVTYNNQLCFFNVFYEYNGERVLLDKYFNNTFQPDGDNKFCYFSLIDDDTIQISFSSASSSFRPRINSKIIVEIYNTLGSKGNFSYIGNKINVNFNNNGEFDKVPVSIIPITECENGMDKPSFTKVKNGIIERFSVRDNLIIDNDLDLFFKHVNDTEDVNDSEIKFIKKRNDVIKRLFNAYLMIRDKSKKVIPTNTAPTLIVSQKYLKKNNYCIKEDTPIVYRANCKSYFIEGDEDASDSVKNSYDSDDDLFYSSPFLFKIDDYPILRGNYYSTYVEDYITMKYNYVNPHLSDNFIIQEVSISKTNINSSKYTLSLNVNTTFNTNDLNQIKVRCVLYNKYDKPYGFFDLENFSTENFYYEGSLETDNTIYEGSINIIDSLYNINGGASPEDILNKVSVDGDARLEIGILIKSDDTNVKQGVFANMTDIDEYTTALIFNNEDEVTLFKDLYNYMESDIRTSKYEDSTMFNIKQFPLVERTYFENLYFNFYNIWNVYLDIIKENIDKLENNTSVDIKLTNTYGPSRFYYYDVDNSNTSKEPVYKYIDNVHLNLDMIIHLNYYIDSEMDEVIKRFISDYLEECNEEQLFPISNLITALKNRFDIIKYMEFFKIGDNETQKLRSTFTSLLDMTKEEVEDYVPEYLNIEKKLDLSTKTEDSIKTKVNYPYNYNINITYK